MPRNAKPGGWCVSPPRPLTTVNDTVAVRVELRAGILAPIFSIAQITVAVGVEGPVTRLPRRAVVRWVKASTVPAVGIFSPTDPTIPIRVPIDVAGGSIVVPFCGRDATV